MPAASVIKTSESRKPIDHQNWLVIMTNEIDERRVGESLWSMMMRADTTAVSFGKCKWGDPLVHICSKTLMTRAQRKMHMELLCN